jgi:hypothetical protein
VIPLVLCTAVLRSVNNCQFGKIQLLRSVPGTSTRIDARQQALEEVLVHVSESDLFCGTQRYLVNTFVTAIG